MGDPPQGDPGLITVPRCTCGMVEGCEPAAELAEKIAEGIDAGLPLHAAARNAAGPA